jgi:hypothetical protein
MCCTLLDGTNTLFHAMVACHCQENMPAEEMIGSVQYSTYAKLQIQAQSLVHPL